jgi:hypothetical protein
MVRPAFPCLFPSESASTLTLDRIGQLASLCSRERRGGVHDQVQGRVRNLQAWRPSRCHDYYGVRPARGSQRLTSSAPTFENWLTPRARFTIDLKPIRSRASRSSALSTLERRMASLRWAERGSEIRFAPAFLVVALSCPDERVYVYRDTLSNRPSSLASLMTRRSTRTKFSVPSCKLSFFDPCLLSVR